MKAYASFRERALHESLRYGDDPYVFLRELVQNARDAGARLVRVAVSVEASRARIVFEDDGSGMSFKHAKGYLFRLYASSKEDETDAAGRFGVGFWSVLRWAPESLRIESRTGDDRGATEAWGVELDAGLSKVTDVRCGLERGGTRIVLDRVMRDGDLESLARTVRERLAYYCKYVRVRGGKERLQLWCNGERLDRELDVASVMEDSGSETTLAMSFASAGASGIVALAATPKVLLYARGLLVSETAVLDELDGAASGRRDAFGSSGLAPVVVLNSDRLDVVLSRRKPRDGRELRRLMRLARARLDRLVSHAVDGVVDRSPLARVSDMIAGGVRALGGGLAVAVLLVWLLVIGVGALAALLFWRVPQGGAGERTIITVVRGQAGMPEPRPAVGSADTMPASGPRPVANIVGYGGAIVDVPDSYGPAWSFNYNAGPPRVFFKALTLDNYESAHGFVRRGLPVTGEYVGVTCGRGPRGCIAVETDVVANDTPFVLPVPTGFGVVEGSVTLDGAPQVLASNAVNEALLQLAAGRRGTLRYQVAPAPGASHPPTTTQAVSFGEPWDGLLARAVKLPVPARVELVTSFVRDNVRYDVTPMTAALFAQARGDWHTRVLAVGAGDCDVKNGLNALLLRQIGVDARLAIGIAGEDGVARPSLHAWTEYLLNGRWHVKDATGQPAGFDAAGERAREMAATRGAAKDSAVVAVGMPSTARPAKGRKAERRAAAMADAMGARSAVGVAERSETAPRGEPPPVSDTIMQLETALMAPASVALPSAAPSSDAVPSAAPSSAALPSGAPSSVALPSAAPSSAAQPSGASSSAAPSPAAPLAVVPSSAPESIAAGPQSATKRPPWLLVLEAAGARVVAWTRQVPPPILWSTGIALGSLVVIAFMARRRVRELLVNEGPQDARREALAKMVHDMLTQPHAWRGVGRAWHQRLLPVLSGRPMSLEEALRRARDNVLFVSRSRSKLADMAARCGTPVLDAADPFFGKVVVPLLRTVDLDSIEPLLNGRDHTNTPHWGITRANAVLADARADVCFVLADALQDAPLRDVDLTRVRLPKKLTAPRRFIAVSPTHREVRARLEKLERDPERGVFIWLDWSVERSELLADHTRRVRERAAAYAVDALGAAER